MSQRETLVAALHTALSGLCSGRVYRTRKEQLPALPAIVIRPLSGKELGGMIGYSDATLTVAIEIYAHGDTPDQAADPVLSAVLGLLQASSLGLPGNAQINPEIEYDWAVENYDDSGVTLHLDITYRTV